MREMIIAAAMLVASAPTARSAGLDDLWMACDLAQIDALGDAPLPDRINVVRLQPTSDGQYLIQLLASTSAGDALFCELDYQVVTFRHGSTTIIGE
ncbi:hypothetical protein [Acuticoccus sediminis]|nr:hypothetical protein [Acuticoccus sediminis]